MMYEFFVAFFLLNALFWGLMPHSTHCALLNNLGVTKCPDHWMHVYIFGLGCFIITLYLVQGRAPNA